MFNQLNNSVVRHCVHIGQTDTPNRIGHDIAKQIAEAYTWSWVTVWFAETGQIGHPIMGEQFAQDPVGALMHALFGCGISPLPTRTAWNTKTAKSGSSPR